MGRDVSRWIREGPQAKKRRVIILPFEQPACERGLTATLAGVFEANWSFYRCQRLFPARGPGGTLCRVVGIDNENDQVS